MMGKHENQKSLFSYSVDLDNRVREDHPLRRVAEVVDFSLVRGEVKEKYGANGNGSVDPEVILKLMFLLFWDDVRSERELMKVLAERLDYLWFIGYGLDDEIPDHSVLSKARALGGGSRRVAIPSKREAVRRCRAGIQRAASHGREPGRGERLEGLGPEDRSGDGRAPSRGLRRAQEAKLEGCKPDRFGSGVSTARW